MSETKISVTLDTKQFEYAISKANELVDVINKAKTLSNDLAYTLQNLKFSPAVSEKQVDER